MAATCNVVEPEPPKPSEFSKQQREKLGNIIHAAILTTPEEFPILPNVAPYDKLYDFTQLLYNLASHIPHNDTKSPDVNRWDLDRRWTVTILDQERAINFIAPGGNLYISTGMLKTLRYESELFYLFAFEVCLMDERYLFNRLLNEYNTSLIEEAIKELPSVNTPSARDLARTISELNFDEEQVREIDEFAASLICNSSQYNRKSIIEILTIRLNEVADWSTKRPSYYGRVEHVESLSVEDAGTCGNLSTLGKYQEFVLDILD